MDNLKRALHQIHAPEMSMANLRKSRKCQSCLSEYVSPCHVHESSACEIYSTYHSAEIPIFYHKDHETMHYELKPLCVAPPDLSSATYAPPVKLSTKWWETFRCGGFGNVDLKAMRFPVCL